MPKQFIKAVKAIEKRIRAGEIPRHYYKRGKRYATSAYAIARKATGYYGTTHDIGIVHRKRRGRR